MTDTGVPKGLFYFSQVIPEELVEKLIAWFEGEDADWKSITSNPNSRKVMMYGYSYNYNSGIVTDPAEPITDDLTKLIDIVAEKIDLPKDYTFNQCIINKYEHAQGISPHIDRQPQYGAIIACFTIGAGAILEFSRAGYQKYSLYTEPGSLYIMTDESRSKWKHSMPGRLTDPGHGPRETRYSITFRSVVA
jgi:alkylated DNA repair dioxygenase AlkB